jgi:hypothetical protein
MRSGYQKRQPRVTRAVLIALLMCEGAAAPVRHAAVRVDRRSAAKERRRQQDRFAGKLFAKIA